MKTQEGIVAIYDAEHNIEFHPELRLADLVESNYKLLPVLERFDIKLGFGETTIEQKCAELDIPVNFFIMVCNIHTYDRFKILYSDIDSLGTGSIGAIIYHLVRSHTYFLEHYIPLLRERFAQISDCCGSQHTALLQRFLESYQKEVKNHFDYEEKMIFPYIYNIMNGRCIEGTSIEQFEKNHSNIDEKISDLKSILLKYITVDSGNEIQYRILFHIYRFQEDINKHTFIEKSVLIPLVMRLERELANKKFVYHE